MTADKFEVVSCMRHFCLLLASLRMTTEYALLYLDHPVFMSLPAEIPRLLGSANEFLANKYKDYTKFHLELMNFPLVGIEAIFSGTDLVVVVEDSIYTFMFQLARE